MHTRVGSSRVAVLAPPCHAPGLPQEVWWSPGSSSRESDEKASARGSGVVASPRGVSGGEVRAATDDVGSAMYSGSEHTQPGASMRHVAAAPARASGCMASAMSIMTICASMNTSTSPVAP